MMLDNYYRNDSYMSCGVIMVKKNRDILRKSRNSSCGMFSQSRTSIIKWTRSRTNNIIENIVASGKIIRMMINLDSRLQNL